MERCYTTTEAAELLRCSPQTVRDLIHAGELDAFTIGAGKLRKTYVIPDHAIRDYVDRKTGQQPTRRKKKEVRRGKPDLGIFSEAGIAEMRRKRSRG